MATITFHDHDIIDAFMGIVEGIVEAKHDDRAPDLKQFERLLEALECACDPIPGERLVVDIDGDLVAAAQMCLDNALDSSSGYDKLLADAHDLVFKGDVTVEAENAAPVRGSEDSGNGLNAREQLAAAAGWLAYQNEDLSFGLKNAEDGLKLWRYAQAHPADLAEFCDEVTGEKGDWTDAHFKQAIGYNPFNRG